VENALFPYTAQPFSGFHKNEKIFESGLCSQFIPLWERVAWTYLNQPLGRALEMSKTRLNKTKVFDSFRQAFGRNRQSISP